GLCHADEPSRSARRALYGLLSAASSRACAVRLDPRPAHLGRRHPADLCGVGCDSVVVSQSSAEDAALVGGRFVHPSDSDGHGFFGPLSQPFSQTMDGSQAAGREKVLRGHQHLRARNGAADHGAELGGMETGTAVHAFCHLRGCALSPRYVDVACGGGCAPRRISTAAEAHLRLVHPDWADPEYVRGGRERRPSSRPGFDTALVGRDSLAAWVPYPECGVCLGPGAAVYAHGLATQAASIRSGRANGIDGLPDAIRRVHRVLLPLHDRSIWTHRAGSRPRAHFHSLWGTGCL